MHKLPTMQIILSFLEPAEKEHRVLYRMEGDGRWWLCYQKGEGEHPNKNFIWETLDGQVYPSAIKSHNSVVVWIEMAAIGSPIYVLSHQGVTLPVKIRRCGPVRVDVVLEEVCCWGELWGFKKNLFQTQSLSVPAACGSEYKTLSCFSNNCVCLCTTSLPTLMRTG